MNDIFPLYADQIRKAPDHLPPGVATKREYAMLQMIANREYQDALGLADFNRDLRRLEAEINELRSRLFRMEHKEDAA